MQISELPKGIDIVARVLRGTRRKCLPKLRDTIRKLAAESLDIEHFDVAASAFLEEYPRSGTLTGRAPLIRLARFYVRHFRRQMIREHQFLGMAARPALEASDRC